MQTYHILTFVICLAAIFSYINYRYIKWTPTVGMVILSVSFSVILLASASLFRGISSSLIAIITSVDFPAILMQGMLGFLLFAGSIHIDANTLRKVGLPVLVLSTVGILISTFLIGSMLYFLFGFFHSGIEYIYCLLFAALISPTDPIAVLAILKRAGLSKSLEMKIAGESLFNDGVAVVVFLTILEVAHAGNGAMSATDVGLLFAREAVGGILWGLLLGYVAYYAMKSIDKYEVEVLITIATVMGGYLLADMMHISGPLAMVVAGIVIGSRSRQAGVSDITLDYLNKFWELIDEILNALLFMLVGFEMLVIKLNATILVISIISIFLILLARWISVVIPVTLLRLKVTFEKHTVTILTWGGLRGGLSVALALSLPKEMYRDQFVTITWIVVIFSIIVQGLTIGKLYRKLENKR